MSFFGQYSEQGDLIADTNVCILTGARIEPGDLQVMIPGTRCFYRVSAAAMSKHTPEVMAEIHKLLESELASQQPIATEPPAAPPPADNRPTKRAKE